MHSTQHQAALHYASNGWPVFPVQGKDQPLIADFANRCSADPATINEWWEIWPDANIGFVPETAGMAVVDVDTYKGATWAEPSSFVVRTPRGGEHHYFRGSVRPSVGKLGTGIDTRGIGSYVLLPGSEGYHWNLEPCGAWDLPELPAWVAEKVNSEPEKRHRPEAIGEDTIDRPQAKKLFKRYLERHPLPAEGNGSDNAVYRAIARGRDLGLSDDCLCGTLLENSPGYDEDWVREKLGNVERYQQNEPGSDTPLTGQEKYGNLALHFPPAGPAIHEPTENDPWEATDPRNPADMPEIEFYDTAKFLPKIPDGCVGIVYGRRGEHKTNTVLSMLAMSSAKHIIYAAGEGAYGLERDRLAARPELQGRLKLLRRVPLFSDPSQVGKFIAANLKHQPEIVVIDTMTNALSGEDLNSDITASYLADNGPAGAIRRAFGATVILIAHAGKDATKGVKGSSGYEDNADFVILVESFRRAGSDTGCVKTSIAKMRDGYDGYVQHWQFVDDPLLVPVPRPISDADFAKWLEAKAPTREKTTPIGTVVWSYLRRHQIDSWDKSVDTAELSRDLTVEEHGPKAQHPEDDWETWRALWQRQLTNNKNKEWAKVCNANRVYKGGKELTVRWFLPPDRQVDE
jgi:Bifunctional DNA primase/polymerase, N-terminal/AAA domain